MTEAQPLNTVGEVRDALCMFPSDALVQGTWEGITMGVRVYRADDGRVLIDCDKGDYQASFQKLQCQGCGKQATTFHSGVAYCHYCACKREDQCKS